MLNQGEKYFDKAKLLFKQGNFKKAEKYFQAASKVSYYSSLSRLYIGAIELYELKIAQAFNTLQTVLTSNENISEAYYYLAKVFQAFDNFQESETYFKKAIVFSKNEVNRLLALEEIKGKTSESDYEGLKKYAYNSYKIRHSIPEDEKLLRRAIIARIDGNYEKSIEIFNELIYLYPDYFCGYYELTRTHIQHKQYHLAYHSLKKMESFFNIRRLYLREFSKVTFMLKKYRESVNYTRRLIKYSPKNPKLYFNLAVSHSLLNNNTEALKNYKKAIELNPSFFAAYYNIGVIYQKNGFLEESLEYYQQALVIKPEDAGLHYNLGLIYFEIQDYFQSLYYFMKAYQLDNSLKEAASNFEVIRNIKTLEKNVVKPLELTVPSKVSLIFTFMMIIMTFLYFLKWV